MIIIIIRIWTTETNGDIKKQSVWRDLSYWSLVSPGQRWTGRRWDPPDVWCLFLSCCNSFRLQHVRCARSPPGGRTWNHKHMTLTLVKLTDATWLILQVTCLLTGTSLFFRLFSCTNQNRPGLVVELILTWVYCGLHGDTGSAEQSLGRRLQRWPVALQFSAHLKLKSH